MAAGQSFAASIWRCSGRYVAPVLLGAVTDDRMGCALVADFDLNISASSSAFLPPTWAVVASQQHGHLNAFYECLTFDTSTLAILIAPSKERVLLEMHTVLLPRLSFAASHIH